MLGSDFKQHFHLEPHVSYFDHGGFSILSHRVRDYQIALKEKIDLNPSMYFRQELVLDLEKTRDRVGKLLNFHPDRLCFMGNASQSFAMILKNLRLESQDTVMVSDELYAGNHAILNLLKSDRGVQMKVINTRNLYSSHSLVDAFLSELDASTKIVVLEHVASPSGRLYPVREIATALKREGLIVIIDGSQAVGSTPLSLLDIPFDFYFGNHHKWMSAPRSSSFLAFSDEWAQSLRGLITVAGDAWRGRGEQVHQDTNFPGAYDPSALLSVPVAIDFIEETVPGGWNEYIRLNHQNLVKGLDILRSYVEVQPVAPEEAFAAMVLCAIPSISQVELDRVSKHLREDNIVIQVFQRQAVPHLRVCHAIYTSLNDYHKLGQSLSKLSLSCNEL